MSPKRSASRARRCAAAVFAGSLWYSNAGPSANVTAPVSPGGQLVAVLADDVRDADQRPGPTLPGWVSQSSLVIHVEPQPSVEA